MPTKTEILEALEDSHQELTELLEDLPDELMLEPGVVGEWSIKDILNHLTHWEGQLVTILFQAQRGTAQPTTPHFGTESVDEVNQRWFESGKDRSLDMVWQDWNGVRKQTIRRVSEFTDEELNDPRRYPWQKGKPLAEWIENDSYGHEDEHADEIRAWLDQHEDPGSGSNNGNGHSKN